MVRTFAVIAVLALALGCGAPEDTAVAWATTVASLEASPADRETVLRKLASQDRVEVVWGAYLAGELGVTSATEPLLGLLQDGPFFAGYALDALARLGARVSSQRLRTVLEAGADHMTAIAVALQEPSVHRDLLFEGAQASIEKLSDDQDWEYGEELAAWHGYANALVAIHDRAFAATLLANLRAGVDIDVVSPDETFPPLHCNCGAWGRSHCYFSVSHSTLPPRGVWSFESPEADSCTVLLPGPVSVCLGRTEAPGFASDDDDTLSTVQEEEGPSPPEEDVASPIITQEPNLSARDACPPVDDVEADAIEPESPARNNDLLAYLGALVGGAELPPFDGVVAVRHVWRDEAAYRASVRDARHRIEGQYRELTAALRDAYVLPDDMPSWTPYVEVEVSDLRSCGATGPIPRN